MSAHQPLDPFTGDVDATAAQNLVHSRAAVGAAGAFVDVDDLRQQAAVELFPFAWFPLPLDPSVEGGRLHAEDPEDGLDPEAATKLVHAVVDQSRGTFMGGGMSEQPP
ncbi:hypothetical protein [Allorhizocola rhizosphaerae]|uniref:hypothetical protein n=1 Tax=Allorhizocola rhizosphaerae TaxID=1872709 RepID=UPI001FE90D23|nr:hypothetical protein [Allorhizocola rhizosphaerae]